MDPGRKKLLLHACCAICASEISEKMKESYDPAVFFSNSNIDDNEEYEKRRSSAERLAKENNLPFFEDKYDHDEWLKTAKSLSREPEGGKRCLKCFEFRLRRAAEFAMIKGFKKFSTTLPASPFKNESTVCTIGRKIGKEKRVSFIDPLENADKKERWKTALKRSGEAGYYRQRYCGCEFSRNPGKRK